MDNESFRKLYASNKPGSADNAEKTTKEIAREAVEEEFTNKRRRGRFDRQGYGRCVGRFQIFRICWRSMISPLNFS